jgi:hypothetical protein
VTLTRLNPEFFARCAVICDDCAEKASTLTPDRRILIYCRYAAERCREVKEVLVAGRMPTIEMLISCIKACDRVESVCKDSILMCCQDCAVECARIAAVCGEHVLAGSSIAA